MAAFKDRLTGGFHVFCDQRGAMMQLFRERFDIRGFRTATTQNVRHQVYGVYVLNYFHGLVYGWTSEFLGQTPYLGELLQVQKHFHRVYEESVWSALKYPKFKWADLVSPADDATRTLKVDRASGYEFELGTNAPPPGNVTRLMFNFCPYRDFFVDKSATPSPPLELILARSHHLDCRRLRRRRRRLDCAHPRRLSRCLCPARRAVCKERQSALPRAP
jgi:hypothetical protein